MVTPLTTNSYLHNLACSFNCYSMYVMSLPQQGPWEIGSV